MIRVSIYSKNSSNKQQLFESFFQKEHLEYTIISYQKNSHQDIYIFEVQQKEDLKLIEQQPHHDYALYYVIGPKDYDMVSECMRLKVNLYFSKESLPEDIQKNESHMLQDIQDKFQYYEYQRNGIVSKIRLSHIYYVESMVERKNLNAFLNTIHSTQFIQIHKSFIVNKQWIQNIFSDHILLKNAETLQIGRAYKGNVKMS